MRSHSSTSVNSTGLCATPTSCCLLGPAAQLLPAPLGTTRHLAANCACPSNRATRPTSNTELAEGLVVFRRVWLVLQLIEHPRVIHHFEVIELPKNVHVALRLRRLSQNRRQQNPPLPVHLNHLSEIAGPHQKLALGRVRARHLRELVLDLSPHLQRINQRHFTGLAGNVELIAVLFERLQKLGGDLQTTLLVHLRRRVASQFHGFGLVGGSACPLRPLPPKAPYSLLLPTTLPHFLPQNRPNFPLVKRNSRRLCINCVCCLR